MVLYILAGSGRTLGRRLGAGEEERRAVVGPLPDHLKVEQLRQQAGLAPVPRVVGQNRRLQRTLWRRVRRPRVTLALPPCPGVVGESRRTSHSAMRCESDLTTALRRDTWNMLLGSTSRSRRPSCSLVGRTRTQPGPCAPRSAHVRSAPTEWAGCVHEETRLVQVRVDVAQLLLHLNAGEGERVLDLGDRVPARQDVTPRLQQ